MVDDTVATSPGRGAGGGLRGLLARIAEPLRTLLPVARRSPVQSAAFTSAFVSLAAKMAAADGVAIAVEYDAFEQFLEVAPSECANVRRVYDHAKADVTGFEIYADRIGELLADDAETRRRVFECLMFIACADGVLHPAEDHFLKTVACRLHFTDAEFRVIRAQFIHDPESPYAILDVAPDATVREIKARYKTLVQLNHPDRLTADGAPPAVIKAATVKLAAINNAYAEILKQRGHGS
jgi:DnaJ like chaperone protein